MIKIWKASQVFTCEAFFVLERQRLYISTMVEMSNFTELNFSFAVEDSYVDGDRRFLRRE